MRKWGLVLAALGLSACPIYGSLGYWEQVGAGATSGAAGSGGAGSTSTSMSTASTTGTGGAEDCSPSSLGTGAPGWSQGYGGPSGATSVAIDAAGDLVVVGDYQDPIDFGCGPLTNSGSLDMFVAKLSPTGACMWSQGFGGSMAQVTSMTLDAAGDVFVAGSFQGSIDFGATTLTSAGMGNMFVVKLDPSGAPTWSKGFGNGQSQVASVAVDAEGNVVMIGNFQGSLDFGGNTTVLEAGTGYALFVAKLDPTGNPIWSKGFANVGAASVAVDAMGDAVVTGEFTDSFDFGGCTLTTTAPNNGFVAKLDPSGACAWNKVLGTALATAVAVDADGKVIVTGAFTGSMNLGGSTFTSTPGMANMFVAELDPGGTHLWSKGFPGGEASPLSVAVDASGDVFVTGALAGTVDFGGPTPLTSTGGNDVLLASFDPSGNYRWANRFGNQQDQAGSGVAVDTSCHVVIVGDFQGTVDFGGNPLVSTGGSDTFVATFDR